MSVRPIDPEQPLSPRSLRLAALVGLCMVAGVVWWMLQPALGRFDSWAWQNAENLSPQGARARMVHDLIRNELRPGTDQRRVLSLLGPCDDEYQGAWFYRVYRDRTDSLRYYALEFDVNLRVSFDGAGRVKRAELIHPAVLHKNGLPSSGGPGYMSLE